MRIASVILVLIVALTEVGCGHTRKTVTPPPSAARSIELSSDFRPAGAIPRSHTCDGTDVSPPLRAAGLPVATRELVVVMRDHDAPGGDFIHWAIAHIDPRLVASPRAGSIFLAAGAKPAGAVIGLDSFGSLGYRGPCPPPGDAAHHYEITVYALGRPSRVKTGFSAGAVAGLDVLSQGSLTGVYARH
jgi:Raf kinase inhibitor-like YbhB/YbcL family protein